MAAELRGGHPQTHEAEETTAESLPTATSTTLARSGTAKSCMAGCRQGSLFSLEGLQTPTWPSAVWTAPGPQSAEEPIAY